MGFSVPVIFRSYSKKASAPAGPVTLIYDTFTDTDNTLLTDHTIAPTNTPATAWSEIGNLGVSSIRSNTARMSAYVGNAEACTVVDAGTPNVHITADVYHYNHSAIINGLCARATGFNSRWELRLDTTNLKLMEWNIGATQRASAAASLDSEVFYETEFILDGDNLTGKVNGVEVNYASSLFNTVTKHGIKSTIGFNSWALQLCRIDNFKIETIP